MLIKNIKKGPYVFAFYAKRKTYRPITLQFWQNGAVVNEVKISIDTHWVRYQVYLALADGDVKVMPNGGDKIELYCCSLEWGNIPTPLGNVIC